MIDGFKSDRILIVGLGLIGGSLALALHKAGFARELIGFDLKSENCELALALDAVDRIETDLGRAVAEADIVVLSVPVKAMEGVLERIAPYLRSNTLLTDVGSTKGNVVTASRRIFNPMLSGWVPGHPIAGAENSGMAAARQELFARHKIILTPLPESSAAAVDIISSMWRATGAEVLTMDVDHHDEVLAATSHLPHLLAFSLVDTLAQDHENRDIFRYAAGGFRDFTRIAASDPTMWHDVFLANRDAVLEVLDRFTDGLSQLRTAVEQGDGVTMMGVFTRAKAAREHFSRILAGTAYASPAHKLSKKALKIGAKSRCIGYVSMPGDKSISHRALILGALSEGQTVVSGMHEDEDTLATLQAFRDMGVVIEGPAEGLVTIHGVGLHGLRQAPGALYLGRSSTSLRLLTGLLAAQSFPSELTGSEMLEECDLSAIIQPLQQMGAKIDAKREAFLPISISGIAADALQAITHQIETPSAQVKSALLLASMYAEGETRLTERVKTRDHTEKMMAAFGWPIQTDGNVVCSSGKGQLLPGRVAIPGDISLAAYFMVAALITRDSDLRLENLGVNPSRTSLLDLLIGMGGLIEQHAKHESNDEPGACLYVRYSRLKPCRVELSKMHCSVEELAALLIALSFAEGESVLLDWNRVAQVDALNITVNGLQKLGIQIESKDDCLLIQGVGSEVLLAGHELDGKGNSVASMALAIAAMRTGNSVIIEDCLGDIPYFPEFVSIAQSLGFELQSIG
ncbi:bifunctional prephenate dehydrogenase/3-phosphoshikimate 1-carboxyvinyltransferase [Pokkaliibacter plantistimulans]|uniref:prephenate dehydrogenase n=1 Tax=Proteobacteria bacterium 228 TaxID=2083153 RepID=A0A2S5KR12_9PROT|nr:prephenate dehydrogenase/arogenate dehydrogenase family protein [Pokkaliibacter plantistimulans]PPC77095.1 bifunctional prephenate dehydrogenase/3-phosphoshikimate 1-carboxyvinyltransferase [Pokkaliibacter plantistimulans]